MVFTRKFSEFPSGTLTEAVGLAGDVNTRGDTSGGGGGSVTEIITQDTSALAVGRWVRFDQATNLYVHALADTDENAEVAGVVLNIISANQFTLQQSGFIESGTPGFNGFTVGIYFLSDTMLGQQTLTIPTTNGYVNKPVFSATSADSGEVICLSRGAVIGSPGPIPNSGGGTDSNTHTISQPGNTFSIGDWVYVSGDTTYSLAIATSLAPSQSVGVVISAGDPNFTIQFAGWNSNTVTGAVDSVGAPVGIVSGTTYYLSETTLGEICPTPPLLASSYSKPLFTSESHTSGTGYIWPQRPLSGEATDNPNIIPVNQPGHGFSNGDVIRVSAADTYARAQANNALTTIPVGFAEVVDANNFILHTSGYADFFTAPFTPLLPSARYFLSPTVLGGITTTEPSTVGQYSVPVLIGLNGTTGYILEQRPEEIVAAPAPGAGWTLISSNVMVNQADLIVTNMTGFYRYMFIFENVIPVTNGVFFSFQTSSDNGATFNTTLGDYSWNGVQGIPGTFNAADNKINLTGAFSGITNIVARGGFSGEMKTINPANNLYWKIFYFLGNYALTSHGGEMNGMYSKNGLVRQTALVNAVKFFMSAGNISSGTIKLYGTNV